MKFLCDRCKTRYSIGDDRVRGKILKIRCKNCANVITVREGMTDGEPASAGAERGRSRPTTMAPNETSSTPAAPPPPAASSGANGAAKPPPALDEEWYVSIDGEQSGPFSLAEAQKWIASKPLSAELHCWSEGFDDWRPVDKVSHFRNLRKKPAAPPPRTPGGPSRTPVSVVAAPAPAPARVEEEEPKPLFAATMASLEARPVTPAKPAAGARPPIARATPPEGSPIAPASTKPSAPVPAMPATPATPAVEKSSTLPKAAKTNGSPATTPSKPAAPAVTPAPAAAPAIPGFDLDQHDDGRADTESASADPFAAVTPHPVRTGRTGSSSAPPAAAAAPAAPVSLASLANGEAHPAPHVDGAEDDGLSIGEVSRVVNLADLVRPAKKADRTGPVRRLATNNGIGLARTGSVPRVDVSMNALGVAAPVDPNVPPAEAPLLAPEVLAEAAPDVVPAPVLRPQRSLALLLIGAVVLLAGIAAVVAIVLSNSDGGSQISLNDGDKVNTERPDEIGRKGPFPTPGSNAQQPKPNTSGSNHPYVRPTGPNGNPIPGLGSGKTEADLTGPTSPLKPDEVEDMSQNQRTGESRCWERALRKQPYLAKDMSSATLTLAVDPTGAVTTAQLAGIPTDDGGLNACLQGLVKSWRFRASAGGTFRVKIVFGS